MFAFPDLQQSFETEIDVTQNAIGTILKQGGHLAAYHSEILTQTKLNYSIYAKEVYALFQALKQWQHCYLVRKLLIISSCNFQLLNLKFRHNVI